MPNVLIISPYFPPSNAADMQRIRMSLPFYAAAGWHAEIVTVDPVHADISTDPLLAESVPENTVVHYVGALPKRYTAKVGLGAIGLRSLWHFKNKVNTLLASGKFDLVYFSTTQFPVCILGGYWKKKYGVPFIIDMQDPWHSDYYQDKPKSQRPKKYWFSYRLNKYMEPIAMKLVDGLISVSPAYLSTLNQRYPRLEHAPQQTITFGFFEPDFLVAQRNKNRFPSVLPVTPGILPVVYIGRGGADMAKALQLLFSALRELVAADPSIADRLHFYFIGTSYAAPGQGTPTVAPVAAACGVNNMVTEWPDRIPFFQAINTLMDAAAFFVPGSDDPQYTASKIYPYVLAGKPLLSIFHKSSSVVSFLNDADAGSCFTFDMPVEDIKVGLKNFLLTLAAGNMADPQPDRAVLEQYSAATMAQRQCAVFNAVLETANLKEKIKTKRRSNDRAAVR